MRLYLGRLLEEEERRQLNLPATDVSSIANAQGRRKILTDILDDSFIVKAQQHAESTWQNQ